MNDRYSVRQSMSIVLFDIGNVLNDVDVTLNIIFMLHVGFWRKSEITKRCRLRLMASYFTQYVREMNVHNLCYRSLINNSF